MKALIKWPGGKSSEIVHIEKIIPNFNRYIEPFFGGGALFFDLMPQKAIINDISENLMLFYKLIQDENIQFKELLILLDQTWTDYINIIRQNTEGIKLHYLSYRNNNISNYEMNNLLDKEINKVFLESKSILSERIILDWPGLLIEIRRMVMDKIKRTKENEIKKQKHLSLEDLSDNILTGFTSGLYMHFRNIYNEINATKKLNICVEYRLANFYFIREYCYGSMFRYNAKGEFNIPYGGISYNKKNLTRKIETIFSTKTVCLLKNTEIHSLDFEDFFSKISLNDDDFIFLDPPYDTDFSDYEGNSFAQADQRRLAEILLKINAKFILIIKNTEFIYSLYNQTGLNILTFDNTYIYNVRSRNNRDVEHLIITNIATN
ncbi:MAG: DNA adenine methylase [Firmicutes bacterium HGW-Firmicutes-12]|jgi:DNA adenine methylase|nr:MAG: DNA adenine methylase [Firmicutes bacterium HGW-Firmicutes-12]